MIGRCEVVNDREVGDERGIGGDSEVDDGGGGVTSEEGVGSRGEDRVEYKQSLLMKERSPFPPCHVIVCI